MHLPLLILFATITLALPSHRAAHDTSACPLSLPSNNYEFPHLIVPINNSDIAQGHSYFATITPNNDATIFNFDIPTSRANTPCSLYFSFPRHDQLSTSAYQFIGNTSSSEALGTLQVTQYRYNTGATDATTGNSQPPLAGDAVIATTIQPDNAYKLWSGSSGAGGVMSWKLSSTDSFLRFFQDWNPCAIGLWLVYE